MSTLGLFSAFLLISGASAASTARPGSYFYAVDIAQLGSTSAFPCLYSNGYRTVFSRAYKPDGSGAVDSTAITNIQRASASSLGSEVYMTPNPKSSKSAATQVDETINNLVNSGISIRSLWIQVTSPVNWGSNTASNVNFISSAISRIRSRGVRPGVYTAQYDWQQITNNAGGFGTDVMLWYWHVFGAGAGGESPADFSDFRAFGQWSAAAVKQFGQSESICSLTANRDVYPASSVTKKELDNRTNFVVGGNVGF